MTAKTLRQRAIIGLVFVLAAAIFWESWQATVAAAAAGGRPTPALWPVTLEGLLAVLVLVYWDARAQHRRYAWVTQVAVWVVTSAAAAVQVLDAPPTWLGWITAALTPMMLLLAVEFAVWLLYGVTVDARGVEVRDGGPPRPGETAEGVPPAAAGADQPSRLVRGTPPPSSVPSPVNGGRSPDAGAVNLPDRAATVTTPTVTVSSRPFTPQQEAVLYRQREKPEGFEAMIVKHRFDPDAAWALARERNWPVASAASANGHRKAVSA